MGANKNLDWAKIKWNRWLCESKTRIIFVEYFFPFIGSVRKRERGEEKTFVNTFASYMWQSKDGINFTTFLVTFFPFLQYSQISALAEEKNGLKMQKFPSAHCRQCSSGDKEQGKKLCQTGEASLFLMGKKDGKVLTKTKWEHFSPTPDEIVWIRSVTMMNGAEGWRFKIAAYGEGIRMMHDHICHGSVPIFSRHLSSVLSIFTHFSGKICEL